MAREPEAIPEPDRAPGAPHPRETLTLYGQHAAETAFLAAWRAGRLHHAWLLRGARGVGKATLAYRIARALLAQDAAPQTLALAGDHPVARRVAAQSEARLKTLRRPWDAKAKRLRAMITVDEVRGLRPFFGLSAADGGWRVAVVDAADEMNPAAANALLKMLEEPPERAMLLLVAQAPGRLLPTIRSRCRTLDLAPLAPDDLARALADAGAGAALRLADQDAPALYARLAGLLAQAPGMDRGALIALADQAAGRDAQARYAMLLDLTVTLLQRLARAGAGAGGPPAAPAEPKLAARLAPDAARARLWAEAAAETQTRAARALLVNLDPAHTVLDIWLRLDAVAARALDR